MKDKKMNTGLKVIIVAGICLLSVYIAYSFTINKEDNAYINSLYKYKQKVDDVNKTVVNTLNNIDSLDTNDEKSINDIKQKLSASLSDIQNILTDVNKIKAPVRYENQFDLYVKGIESNKNFINQIILILNNSKSNDVVNAVETANKYIDESKKYYEASKLKKVYIEIPAGIYSIPDKISKYAFKVLSEYQSKSLLLEQYTSYFDNMDNLLNEFKGVKTSLNSNYLNLVNNETSFDKVYIAIEKKLIEINGMQDMYNNISVPASLASNHKMFNNILNSYTNYCMDFKNTVTKFEESSSQDNSSEIKKLFESLEKNYDSTDKSFNDYINNYNGNKAFYTDITNLWNDGYHP